MKEIQIISEGALAFSKQNIDCQLFLHCVVLAGITQIEGVQTYFIIAVALFRFSAGYGMKIATKTNVRTTQAVVQFTTILKVSLVEERLWD
jgi:Na+/H+-translocating membrane pyrophosphatase